MDTVQRNQLVSDHLRVADRVSGAIFRSIRPKYDLDDLYQQACIGLIEAAERFDPDRGVRFKTYAAHVCRGRVLDWLRETTWIPRLELLRWKSFDRAVLEVRSRGSGGWTPSELQEELAVGDDELDRVMKAADSRTSMLTGWSEEEDDEDSLLGRIDAGEVDHRFNDLEWSDLYWRIVGQLKRRDHRQVATLMAQGLKMREIGVVMKLTESRVCQIWQKARKRLSELGEIAMSKRLAKPEEKWEVAGPGLALQLDPRFDISQLRPCDRHVVKECLLYLARPDARVAPKVLPPPDPEAIRQGNENVIRMCEEYLAEKSGAAGRS